ncbi:MAG TPA: hypothetical protein PLF13_02930 [candidate division Zixibacteria bacterium]|nr:hypothetical protein [candidate division Zixibacteria bacterium]
MSEEKHKILQMLSDGKITVEQAEKLLKAVDVADQTGWIRDDPVREPGSKPRWLRVQVEGHKKDDEDDDHGCRRRRHEHVNIRVPLSLVRAGVKLGSLMPGKSTTRINHALSEHGIELDIEHLDPKSLEELIDALADTSIDVQDGEEKVRIFVE